MKPLNGLYEKITSIDNLFRAAEVTLRRGRRFYGEGAQFKFDLEKEVFKLHEQLIWGNYQHGDYRMFGIRDPKPRTIAAACFRDRVLHHAVHDVTEPLIDRIFIYDSYACRKGKGTHRALERAHKFLRVNAYSLHLDVMSYFQNIDHGALKRLLARYIADERTMKLLAMIIDSTVYLARKEECSALQKTRRHSHENGNPSGKDRTGFPIGSGMTSGEGDDIVARNALRGAERCRREGHGIRVTNAVPADDQLLLPGWELPEEESRLLKGVPLGNLTSQFFANLYLNELDQHVKHVLKVRYYIRYMDDMVLFGGSKETIQDWEKAIRTFAREELKLTLHPSGGPASVSRGLSFLGFRIFPKYRRLKRASVSRFVRRMKKRTEEYFALSGDRSGQSELLKKIRQSAQSFNAHALHGDTYRIRKLLYDRFPIINQYGLAGMRGSPHTVRCYRIGMNQICSAPLRGAGLAHTMR